LLERVKAAIERVVRALERDIGFIVLVHLKLLKPQVRDYP